ncbi:alpha/beta fold hydrolase [Zoogloea sp.]|uniref:alpha/beta fold hydrolase n=1 Tax=Zoogloea sp. TaxID=49181 RepID=UPI00260C10A1|nr:alpha/beta fold hydrolase [Zoogloea sp.]MDD3354759.1 alpha/beta fold hydrolase [Zoogloea sp.]
MPVPPDDRSTTFFLPVSEGHRLFVETWGNPAGEPVLVLHGGPGSGCTPRLKTLYDPLRHWVILPDQRGAGRSEPRGRTEANDTARLVADLERLRSVLGVGRWRVTGGSWGAALGLAYAQAHRQAVSGLVLRSSFMPGHGNIDWFFRGVARHRPAAWQALAAALPEASPETLLSALADRLGAADAGVAGAAALAWQRYEQAVADPAAILTEPDAAGRESLVLKYRLQAHYLLAGCFLEETTFLAGCASLAALPVTLIHGGDDLVCPPGNGVRLHVAIPGSDLIPIPGCGHDPFHPALAAAWRDALARPAPHA